MRVARSLPLVLSGAAIVALLSGCGPGGGSTEEAASSAASELKSAASSAASDVKEVASSAASDVKGAASGAASSAASQAGDAARTRAIAGICATVDDGEISGGDRALLTSWTLAAEKIGVPASITVPLNDIVAAGNQIKDEDIQKLKDACDTEQAK
ncbi:hypothetical protein GCM10023081_31560 [Arthrobacter ginkgonis]|uniref:Lipoprotein n=1 Tax=Arthrobacter ginkgonis TaxID=1630594 RepID=A0ABP7CMI0_9MICC